MDCFESVIESLKDQADYQNGMECLIGFLLAQLESQPGYSPQALVEALYAEQQWRLESWALRDNDDPLHVPLPKSLLLSFQRLEAQLQALSGNPLIPVDLPKQLQSRYPRLQGAPKVRFAVVATSPNDTPTPK